MGIIVGGLTAFKRADSEEEGAESEEKPDAEVTKKEKLGKLITLYKRKLAQFNMSDAKRGGGTKWEGLSQLMEEHKLHIAHGNDGIALQSAGAQNI